tara:strand:+ start:118 stop:342 length:225 start_codon:yes stop_codon:yes gene_type:complete
MLDNNEGLAMLEANTESDADQRAVCMILFDLLQDQTHVEIGMPHTHVLQIECTFQRSIKTMQEYRVQLHEFVPS